MMMLAAAQRWVITFAQLLALGYSSSGVGRLVASGRLHRVHQGVYAVGNPDLAVAGTRLAAVLACGPGALLSDAAAGAHLGLRESLAAVTDVTIQRRSSLERSGIRVHCRCSLIDEDRTIEDGIPCTSVARTLLDLSSVVEIEAPSRPWSALRSSRSTTIGRSRPC